MIRSGNEHIGLFESSWTRTRTVSDVKAHSNTSSLKNQKHRCFCGEICFHKVHRFQYYMPFPSPESSWISGQGFWKPRMKPIIDGRCSFVCLVWKGTKSDSQSICGVQKKHMFLLGLWQLDDKIAFFHLDFSGFGSDSLSQRVAKFGVFFRMALFEEILHELENKNPPVLWRSNGKKRKIHNFWM